jgi:molecular chaperone HtpG
MPSSTATEAPTATAESASQRLEFKTELKQLLDLIIHSLYTKKEIFLRELISNAADAIDKIRFEALTRPELLGGDSDFKIRLIPDKEAGTLTVSDNGIGMTREQVVQELGTIARSGTKAFIENLKNNPEVKERPELIGQFGVGFYSAFMAADRVTVISRAAGAGPDEAAGWESDGQGEFTVAPAHRDSRGTDVILHLREDAKEFLEPWRLRQVVKQYSDFIEHPIVLKDDKGEDQVLNSRKAIWLRARHEVKPEEYNEFYKQVAHDSDDPLRVIHISAEGGFTEFKTLLFIPKHRPLDFFYREPKSSVDLYVKRVLITHECEDLLPTWLRFVKGVVDSSDLPLNVSRETLQHHPLLAKIKSNLVNRVLKTLEEMKDAAFAKAEPSEDDEYVKFFEEFGTTLKEGIVQDWSNKERLADLMLFESTQTKPGRYTTLAKYVERMVEGQDAIYYLVGESRSILENSPYIESLRAKGYEVLLLTDPIDEFVATSIPQYKGKKLTAADRGEAEKKEDESFKPLLEALKTKLPEVKEVRLSSRLKESAAILVADEHSPSAHFERLMKRAGRDKELPQSKRILELNPEHPAVQALKSLHAKDPADPRIETFGRLLYEQAIIAEGSKIEDVAGFAKRINELVVKAAT